MVTLFNRNTDGTVNIDKALLQSPEIKEALDCIMESAFTKAELESYDIYWDSISCEKTLCQSSEDKGRVEGRAEGKLLSAYETTLMSLKNNLSEDIITTITQLPNETIKKLANLLKKYGNKAEEHLNEI